MSKKLREEIITWADDSIRYGQVENSVENVKSFIKEDHHFISRRTLDKATKLYVSLTWK